ncbi:uncharacterized protein P5cr [Halyomorpha halys]|uniref:uncharacterized protein P5cr n=1 Tax=Halyomorpha halys TaxID=286706 RepID=UPI0006D4C81D|nr:pyrroline-5-carboxylate reductase [Halyomorpha halys]
MFSGIIGFIGAGNMAQAIAFGLIDAGAIPGKNVIASAPSMNNLKKFKEKGATVTNDNNQVINTADIIFLSVKPQYLDTAINSLNNIPHETKLYVSILAGIRLETLQEKFQLQCNSKSSYKIIRVLPNTAVLVGAGCSVMAANASTPEEDVSLVKSLMSVGGTCELIPENLINSCSAVCGSGPAFIFMAIEALADGAVLRGVPRDLALKLAAKAVEGAGKLVLSTEKHPGKLKDEVCSPGGTTIVGVHKLEESRLRFGLMDAVRATAERADQLSLMK